jgi:hypothetical protein
MTGAVSGPAMSRGRTPEPSRPKTASANIRVSALTAYVCESLTLGNQTQLKPRPLSAAPLVSASSLEPANHSVGPKNNNGVSARPENVPRLSLNPPSKAVTRPSTAAGRLCSQVADALTDPGFEMFQSHTNKLDARDIEKSSATPLFRYLNRKSSSSLDTCEIEGSKPKTLYPWKQRRPSSLTTMPRRPYSAFRACRNDSRMSKQQDAARGIKDLSLRTMDIEKTSVGSRRDCCKKDVSAYSVPCGR